MNRETACLLCGESSREVRPRLVSWKVADTGSEYQVIPRCADVFRCRERCLANGEEWIAREPVKPDEDRHRVGDPLPMPTFEVRRG